MMRLLASLYLITTVHGHIFNGQDIAQTVKDHVQGQLKIADDFEIILTNNRLQLSGDALELDKVTLTDNDRQFEAWLKSPEKIKFSGRIQPLTEIPILTRAISPGDIIADSDLDWKKIPSNRLTPVMMRQVSDVIGKTAASRVLQAGQPLLKSDLKAPLLIKKGDNVSIKYQIPGMFLTTIAIALQDGAKGDTIRFQSPSSKKEIRARIIDQNRAEITPMEIQ